jgi:plastocyanin
VSRFHSAFVPVVLVLALAAVPVAAARHHALAKTSVTVKMTEFKFALSSSSVPTCTVAFQVVNKGKIKHDFAIAGKKTAQIGAGKKTTLIVSFKKKGKYPYKCTLDSHAKFGMKGTLTVK